MNKVILRPAALLCTAVLLCCALAGCGGPELEEIAPRLKELTDASLSLNSVLYGAGLPTLDNAYTGTDYRYVDTGKSSYKTLSEIYDAVGDIYTMSYAAQIRETAFTGVTDEAGSVLPRFTEDSYGSLMQHIELTDILPGERCFLYDTAELLSSSPRRVKVRIKTTLDGKEDEDAVLTLLLEEGVWRLDTPTY